MLQVTAPALLALLTAQTPVVNPDLGPGQPNPTGAVPDGDPDRMAVHGQTLGADAVKDARIEHMDAVLERAKTWVQPDGTSRLRNGAQGEWRVPSRKEDSWPASGSKCLMNRWGDTSMGIGLGAAVGVETVKIARHGNTGIEAPAVRVLGFLGGQQVATSEWIENLAEDAQLLTIGFDRVDRIVFEAQASPIGAGFYSIDDLTLWNTDGTLRTLDFEDLDWGARPAKTDYAGFTWEEGTGSFDPPGPRIVPAPQEPPTAGGTGQAPVATGTGGGSTTGAARSIGGNATAPTFLRDFNGPRLGDPGAGFIPPDTCGAVGIDHYCAVVNQHLSIYEKDTQNRVTSVSLQSFFNSGGSVGDPRIAYDFPNDRWVIIATNFGELLFFAYSLTPDPTGNWFKANLDLVDGFDTGRWIDYPTLGVDSRGVFVEAYMVGSPARMSIFAIDTAPLLGTPAAVGTVTAFRNLSWDGAIQHGSQYTEAGTSWMVSTAGNSALRLRRIDPPMTAPTLTSFTVSIPNWSSPPNAPALGSTVDVSTVGPRLMNAAYAGGSLWTAHCVNASGRAAARWYEVDPATQTLLQSGTVTDPSLNYYFPSVAADAEGNVVMGFTGSDDQTFPSCYATGRVAADVAGEMAPPAMYAAGLASYTITDGAGRNRWGDYSLTTLDPVDGSFWTIQERTRNVADSWITHIAQYEYESCNRVNNFCTPIPAPGGGIPTMNWSGSTSVAANDLALLATGIPPNQFGLFFYSDSQAFTFLGDGVLCLGQPLYRIAPIVQSSVFGVASLAIDNTAPPVPAAQIMAGDTWNFSFWFRQASPFGYNFADGLSVTFCD